MMTYKRVKQKLYALEQRWFNELNAIYPRLPIPSVANGYVQFFSCDLPANGFEPRARQDVDGAKNANFTLLEDQEYLVICGVGINYTQSAKNSTFPVPSHYLQAVSSGKTWIVDDLSQMRKALDLNLGEYLSNSSAWFANGYASSSGLLPTFSGLKSPYPYILIATNVSPFLTQKMWSHYASSRTAPLLGAWNPNKHICDLVQALGDAVDLWVVHGKAAVWPTYNRTISPWIMTHNLSRPGALRARTFWKVKNICKAAAPFWPCCQPGDGSIGHMEIPDEPSFL